VARKPDIQYVRFYTDGSAARQLEIQTPQKKRVPQPKTRKQKKYVIYIDPLAVAGIIAAAVLLIAMVVGSIQLFVAQRQQEWMEDYVVSLRQENAELTQTYKTGYDLQEVEKSALALGLVPESEVQHIVVTVEVDEPEVTQTFWDRVVEHLQELFA